MKKIISLLVLAFIFSPSLAAQSSATVRLQKNSSLTISGTTNVVPFKILQNGEKLANRNLTVTATRNQNKITVSENQLSVIVKDFTSNNRMALRDFLKLLKADTYPTLQVQISYLDLQPTSEKGQAYNGNAVVSITITGVKRYYCIPISFNNDGDVYIVNGKKKLSIRDFGLTPVTQMMGLIKVSEWIDIDFHMICKITSSDEI
jgi:hypothetical protein